MAPIGVGLARVTPISVSDGGWASATPLGKEWLRNDALGGFTKFSGRAWTAALLGERRYPPLPLVQNSRASCPTPYSGGVFTWAW
jgi:hypothetical protein